MRFLPTLTNRVFSGISGRRRSRRRVERRDGRVVRQGRQVPGDPRLRSHRAGFLGRRPRGQGASVAEENPARRRHYPADGRFAGRTEQRGQIGTQDDAQSDK